MELEYLSVKVFHEGELAVPVGEFIPLFHDWIREKALDELLVDVADYAHLHQGPGVMLIALEANYNIDFADGRCGLRYLRKAPLEGDNRARLARAFRCALAACRLVEERFAGGATPVRFNRSEFEVRVNDRALGRNDEASARALRHELAGFLAAAFDAADPTFEAHADPRRLLGLHVRLGKPYDLGRVLAAL